MSATWNPMSYNVSPVGFQTQNPAIAQPAGFIIQPVYGTKIDNLTKKKTRSDVPKIKQAGQNRIQSKLNCRCYLCQ
jgi:hypothetical protein